MKKAYSTLNIKAVDDESRTIRGVASTITPDRMEDVVEPKGGNFELPVPLLWQHDHNQPIGHVTGLDVNDDGIIMHASVEKTDTKGLLKDRLDEAWESIKLGLVRGLSIGFRALESEPIKGSIGLRFKKWELLEISSVTIPVNAEANIQTVKSICAPVWKPGRMNGGYKLLKVEPERLARDDGSFSLRMAGDGK